MAKERKDIPQEFKWNIEDMYKDRAACEADMSLALSMAEAFGQYKGRLAESGDVLLEALTARDALYMKAERAFVYSRMKRDEDNRVSEYQALCDRAQVMLARIGEAVSFFMPEFSELQEERVEEWLNTVEGLKVYGHLIEELLRNKPHVLSKPEEKLLAQIGEITDVTDDTFTMLNNADIKFGTVKDDRGSDVEVTHGTYISLVMSKDRRVRKEAYEHMYTAYEAQKNTISSLYNYNTKQDVVFSRIRKYPSAIEASLFDDNVPLSVYENLVAVVNENLPLMHRYMALKKRLLKLDSMEMYDMYVPLIDMPKRDYAYDDAKSIIDKALEPMGEQYRSDLRTAFTKNWADVYENTGKTSGAYSFGSYDSLPYVLLNYDGKLEDVFTVIHEMGHSMNSFYTRKEQPFVYGSHSIFTAEVASTVNEALLMKYLVNNAKDKTEEAYLLNMYLEEFRTTLFRQTMFAEFEKLTHEALEAGETLTAEWLCAAYGDLNRKYYSDVVNTDEHIAMEWARIPHFYNSFYVYKYATGYSAATAISKRLLDVGDEAAADYMRFLGAGNCDYPIELLKIAGVDMSSKKPIQDAMSTFDAVLTRFEALVSYNCKLQ